VDVATAPALPTAGRRRRRRPQCFVRRPACYSLYIACGISSILLAGAMLRRGHVASTPLFRRFFVSLLFSPPVSQECLHAVVLAYSWCCRLLCACAT
jgi:hypothetical protein